MFFDSGTPGIKSKKNTTWLGFRKQQDKKNRAVLLDCVCGAAGNMTKKIRTFLKRHLSPCLLAGYVLLFPYAGKGGSGFSFFWGGEEQEDKKCVSERRASRAIPHEILAGQGEQSWIAVWM